jgi:hypothetical protein
MALSKETIETGKQRQAQLNSWLERHEVKSNEFAVMCSVYEQVMWAYRKGASRITDKMWAVIQEAMKKYEAANIINGKKYQAQLNEFISKYKVPPHRLAVYSNVTEEGILNYMNGTWIITERKWLFIQRSMKKIKEEKAKVARSKRPNLVMEYMVKNLKEHHNTIVMKKHCAHREEELLEQLASAGCNCNIMDTGSDHYVLELKGRWNK